MKRWTFLRKLAVVEEAAKPGADVEVIARSHGVSVEDIHAWTAANADHGVKGLKVTALQSVQNRKRKDIKAHPISAGQKAVEAALSDIEQPTEVIRDIAGLSNWQTLTHLHKLERNNKAAGRKQTHGRRGGRMFFWKRVTPARSL